MNTRVRVQVDAICVRKRLFIYTRAPLNVRTSTLQPLHVCFRPAAI